MAIKFKMETEKTETTKSKMYTKLYVQLDFSRIQKLFIFFFFFANNLT